MLPAGRLAREQGVVGDNAHCFDRAEDRRFVNHRTAVFPEALQRQAVLPQADRRTPQVAIVEVVIDPVRTEQVDAAEVARIVAHDHRLGMTDPGPKHVGPVADRVQGHAVAADASPLERQEVDQEPARIRHRPRLATPERGLVPTIPWRQASTGVVPRLRCSSR